eukprot:SAG31_NODE_626_length_13460_cov_14.387517_2_plen_256_part_00
MIRDPSRGCSTRTYGRICTQLYMNSSTILLCACTPRPCIRASSHACPHQTSLTAWVMVFRLLIQFFFYLLGRQVPFLKFIAHSRARHIASNDGDCLGLDASLAAEGAHHSSWRANRLSIDGLPCHQFPRSSHLTLYKSLSPSMSWKSIPTTFDDDDPSDYGSIGSRFQSRQPEWLKKTLKACTLDCMLRVTEMPYNQKRSPSRVHNSNMSPYKNRQDPDDALPAERGYRAVLNLVHVVPYVRVPREHGREPGISG